MLFNHQNKLKSFFNKKIYFLKTTCFIDTSNIFTIKKNCCLIKKNANKKMNKDKYF